MKDNLKLFKDIGGNSEGFNQFLANLKSKPHIFWHAFEVFLFVN